MNSIRHLLRSIYEAQIFPLLLAFVVGCLVVPQNGGQLELPRLLTMRAMAEHHSFEIGRYIDWTDEWSRTPDGRYFNNRAPGPVLLGFPLFWPLDRLLKLTERGRDAKGRRPWPGREIRTTLSLFLQVLPLCFLVWVGTLFLANHGISLGGRVFFTLAALWANTASIFMNNWSGHGLTACLVFAALLALLYRRVFVFGFTLAAALLCDYVVALLYFPFLALVLRREGLNRKFFMQALAGAVLPGVLWVWYHQVAFGGPFTVANVYQNPMYKDVTAAKGNYLGIFTALPRWEILLKLLFGSERGILVSQPWILVGIPFSFLVSMKRESSLAARHLEICRQILGFAGLGLLLLLLLNSAYGGWFAGNTAGPRYLSSVFIPCAFAIACGWTAFSPWQRAMLWFALTFSLLFRALIFAVHPMAPRGSMWDYYIQELIGNSSNWLRIAIFLTLVIGGLYWVRLRERGTRWS